MMIYEPPRLEHLGNLRTVVGMFSSTSGGVLGTTSPPPGLANTGGLLPNTGMPVRASAQGEMRRRWPPRRRRSAPRCAAAGAEAEA